MLSKEIREDIIRWIGMGWSYQIIHKIVKRKYAYDLTYEELRAVKDDITKDLANFF